MFKIFGKKKHNHQKRHHSSAYHHLNLHIDPKKALKKLSIFYKANIFVFITLLIALFYFVILVSTTPKSFPFITSKIEASLKEKFGDEVTISNSYISFTRYGTLKIAITDLKFFYNQISNQDHQEYIVPRLEGEISIFNLLILRFIPSKIKIINSEITINSFGVQAQGAAAKSDAALLMEFLESVKNGAISINNFEIENANITLQKQTSSTRILIKRSQIRTFVKSGTLLVSSVNKINFDEASNDVDLNANCQLAKDSSLKCDLSLSNFVISSIANLHPVLKDLNHIEASLNANASLVLDVNQTASLVFKASATNGSFSFPDFFSKKIKFSDFSVTGDYDGNLGNLRLSEIRADLITSEQEQQINKIKKSLHDIQLGQEKLNPARLTMSLAMLNIKDQQNDRMEFNIRLQNVPNNETGRLWPEFLKEYGIREWVVEHIKQGTLNDAYTKFALAKNNGVRYLENIEAEINFSGFNINYSDEFPIITNVAGKAVFSKDAMKIAITTGDVLNSKIKDAKVTIDSFSAPVTILNISGKSEGAASDSLKHASNNKEFTRQVDRILNGKSRNFFDIKIPLSNKITLKNTYIAVTSNITGLDNDYIKGDTIIDVKKSFGSLDFNAFAELKNAQLVAKAFDIEKNALSDGALNLAVSFARPEVLVLKNISLWKKEVKNSKKKHGVISVITNGKITGNIAIGMNEIDLLEADIRNSDFGKNNYYFSYKVDKQNHTKNFILKGELFNLGSFIENKFLSYPTSKQSYRFKSQVALNRLLLANRKILKNFYLATNCVDSLCDSASVKANYASGQFISLQGNRKFGENFATANARITDVGYVAEGLGISKKIYGGDAKIALINKSVARNLVLEGKIDVDNSITIFETAGMKRLYKNNLFSQVKDKIFSNDKTVFDSMKIEFDLQGKVLNLKSFIANNYKIGITAKGAIDIANDAYSIKGMIIPGFIVNNLFGIGNIPIIGGVISGLLTGGEGGGLFGIRYEYTKKRGQVEPDFETYKVSAFVPTTIRNLFDAI